MKEDKKNRTRPTEGQQPTKFCQESGRWHGGYTGGGHRTLCLLREQSDQVALADLLRRTPRCARHPAANRGIQQSRAWTDGNRTLLRRPAGADRRTVSRDAKRHHRRGPERRRNHGVTGGYQCFRRLLPVFHPLQPGPAGIVQVLRTG